jgi:hypothetical protein
MKGRYSDAQVSLGKCVGITTGVHELVVWVDALHLFHSAYSLNEHCEQRKEE